MFKRIGGLAAGVFLGLAVMAGSASAHEEINPKIFKTGTPTFFTLSAANEEKVALNKITVAAPKGVPFGEATKQPAGWSLTSKEEDTIVWTADSGGGVEPEGFEQWGFETEGADQPGDATYKVTLGFADGKSDDVDVVVSVTTTGQAAAAAKPSSSDGKSTAAIVLGAGGIILAVIAILLGSRRSRPAAGDGSW